MSDYSEKFEKMRIAGKLAAQTLDMLTNNIKEGVSTNHIDKLGYEFIRDNGGYSAPLYYRGFKKSLCTSLNHVVCHGIPSEDRILEDGDALNVDVTAIVNEHYGDTSRMFCIGKTSVKLNNLINTTYESMMKAIQILKPGIKLGDIGYEIQSYVEDKGFSVVRAPCAFDISSSKVIGPIHHTLSCTNFSNIQADKPARAGIPVLDTITLLKRSGNSATTLKPTKPPQSCPKKEAFLRFNLSTNSFMTST